MNSEILGLKINRQIASADEQVIKFQVPEWVNRIREKRRMGE